jgi:hypothetical protein
MQISRFIFYLAATNVKKKNEIPSQCNGIVPEYGNRLISKTFIMVNKQTQNLVARLPSCL